MKERIKEARKYRKMNQETLATEIGLTRTYITLIECGTKIPSQRTVKDIARVLEVSESWLLTGEGEMLAPATKEQEIAQITSTLFNEDDDSFKYKLIKLVSQMTDEQVQMCKDIIKKLCD